MQPPRKPPDPTPIPPPLVPPKPDAETTEAERRFLDLVEKARQGKKPKK